MVGQVLVADSEGLRYARGVGAHRTGEARTAAVGADTVFPLLSLTKPFTASAILALAADGSIALEDPLGLHLEQLRSPWADIPLSALLTHTSGVSPEIVNRDWPGEARFEPVDRETFLTRVQQFAPQSPAGAAFRYSNVGYGLLGAVIEVVSGSSVEHYLRERLLLPAGLASIGYLHTDWSPRDVAAGSVRGEDRGRYLDHPALPDGAGFNLRASGDLHAPGTAIVAWWQRLREDAWLPAGWSALWLTPHVREPGGSSYGYGWHFRDTPHGRVVGHTGGDRVYAVDFSWYVAADLLVYVATAEARFEADEIREQLHRRLLRRR